MPLGQNPGLKRKPRSIRSQRQKILILGHYANPAIQFLPDRVTKDAALFIDVILLRSIQFFNHVNRQNRQRDQLRVRMLERSARRFSMILKKQNVLKPPVFLKIENTIAEGP